MLEAAIEALGVVVNPHYLLWLLVGCAVGLTVGLIPGLGGTVGMSILLPFIFGMDPYSGMAMLVGMAAVVHTGDTFPSVLLGVPGSSGSQATIMDGYPLARQGQAGRALGACFSASMIGGLIGALTLFVAIAAARPLVLALGAPELFMLTLLGLSMVGILARGSAVTGMLSGLLGMLLGLVGAAPAVFEYRYTFDWVYLWEGLPLTALALGLFALPELVELLSTNQSISQAATVVGRKIQGVRDVLAHKWLTVRTSIIGALLGIVPGIGGSVVDWILYGLAKRTVKNGDRFGTGDIRGVIAPEGGNNAKEGGALVPALLFGVPGSGTTALLLGGMILLGMQPGPKMVSEDLGITLSIIVTLALANVIGAGACFLAAGQVAKLTRIAPTVLVPFLLVVIFVAAYQNTRHWGDIIVLVAVGVLGWIMKQLGWPRAPLLIGFILALPAERYLGISISRYGDEWVTRPLVLLFGLMIVLVLASGGITRLSRYVRRTGVKA